MDPFTMMAVAGAGSSILQGFLGSNGAKKAAAAQSAALRSGDARYQGYADQAEGAINAGTDKALGYVTPYASAGTDALKLYKDAIGVNGRDAQAGYHASFMDDPGFQAALDAGSKQVEHSAIFRGRGDSGATQKELYQFGERERLGAFNSRLDRLSSLSSLGLQAGSQAAGLESGRGSSLADIALKRGGVARDTELGIGSARAGGITGSTNAINGAIGGVSSAAMVGAGGKDAFNTLYGKAPVAAPQTTSLFSLK